MSHLTNLCIKLQQFVCMSQDSTLVEAVDKYGYKTRTICIHAPAHDEQYQSRKQHPPDHLYPAWYNFCDVTDHKLRLRRMKLTAASPTGRMTL